MDFSITFFKLFLWGTYFSLPILLSICVSIIALGLFVGRLESWGRFDALYWAFITAFTVGYGDMRPLRKPSKVLSIAIAWCGIMLTGLFVALAVKAASIAFEIHIDPEVLRSVGQGIID
ncbi:MULTISPECIES: potassium channel family protein [Marinobacter]|uniref:Potassium channel family protein n=1 Tax=Marinobacter xiaoshiensis TaxID=3073652 RepID=A0ABU2HKR0_9GAMM|nr:MULTISPECIES: potassium channel family protein [unclassified Marinobacter]MBK1886247.1 two pore domain potassium channel family protein [Marinobacter sp. DY40_1A1]MDS1311156.1 potassium channel family protein [Marinobacter sp. F60267]